MINNKLKIVIDILMTIVFILLMCNQVTGVFAHEILGISIIILFTMHQILNINYYKNLFKGKYNKLRTAYVIINSLLLIMMIIMIISAMLISQYTLKFLNLSNDLLGRELHIISSYIIYMLIGLHMGLHYNSIVKMKKQNQIILNIFMCLYGLVFGIQGFIKKEFITKVTLQNLYPIYSEDNIIMLLIDYTGILVMFVMLGYGIYNLLKLKGKSGKNE